MTMTEEEVKDLLVKTNAIMNGHFLLTSGLHSPHYVEKFNVLQHPKYTQQLCEAMAEKFKDANIETVVGPMTGGILLAHETGKALGTRAIFTERVDGKMTFRRGFHLHPGERCLIERRHRHDRRLHQGSHRRRQGQRRHPCRRQHARRPQRRQSQLR